MNLVVKKVLSQDSFRLGRRMSRLNEREKGGLGNNTMMNFASVARSAMKSADQQHGSISSGEKGTISGKTPPGQRISAVRNRIAGMFSKATTVKEDDIIS